MKEQKREKHGQSHDNEKSAKEDITQSSSNEKNKETAQEDKKNDEVKEEIKEQSADEKIADLNDKYLRLAAEFDNYRRRTAKERLDLVLTAGEETIKGLLPILDDFERAIDVLHKSEGDNAAAIEGTELIYKKLFAYLENKGLKLIEAVGEELNTDLHEAVAQFPVPEKEKKNKIIDVAQHGYTLNGKVIRFAKVVVGI